ncbi:ABC transporter ATP-binding protein [Agrobacterium vaccinii]|uniref:ABC transporter ATP-binding protein n=1 Tax=Agrobacterium vaccinii TaxID=2735528 RepID=UPI001E4986F1|nr:ABC transporter ATP-binding protein [Agrobacterium vaccinii]UHS59849.1 ABC transporter ATP-binding protein [Agrobacterium vaccinii]
MAFLELQNLGKTYSGHVAVENFTLSIDKGEFVCLLGPSGCGKSTTLQMVAGFVSPTAGRIVLDGRDITNVQPSKRGLGVVFQSYALFPHMTVADNVAFGLQMRNVPRAECQTRVEEALALVQLSALAKRYPKELSGGQRQRVALARAIVVKPPVLLLDEPMGALDALLRDEMQIELRDLQRRIGITTIMVTHDQAEAMTLANRVVLMSSGHVQQIGAPFDMYEQPQGRFVSTFLGRANVFSGTGGSDGVTVSGRTLPSPASSVEGAVDYIIRPEKMTFTNHDALIGGTVKARVFLGHRWLYQVDTEIGMVELTEANLDRPSASEGDHIGLTWSADHVRVTVQGNAQ